MQGCVSCPWAHTERDVDFYLLTVGVKARVRNFKGSVHGFYLFIVGVKGRVNKFMGVYTIFSI